MTAKEKNEKINYYEARRQSWDFQDLLSRYLSFIQYPYGTSEYCVPDEVLDAEIETVRNCLFWDYEYQRLNADEHKLIPTVQKTIMYKFLKFVYKNISEDKKEKHCLNLKNKYFFNNPRVGGRLHQMLSIVFDFLEPMHQDYKYVYFQNLQVGDATGGGNHRMFAETIRNEDVLANVEECDDLDFLKKFKADGACIYEIENPTNHLYIGSDERISLLFILMQIKAGLIPINSLDEFADRFCTSDIPYPTETLSGNQVSKPSSRYNIKYRLSISWLNAKEAFIKTWRESKY